MDDIYIRNIATVEPYPNSTVTTSEEKTSWDLRQMFQKAFLENDDKFGKIDRVYVTSSSNNDEDTYIGFMSMSDPRTHPQIVDKYDGKLFRGRPLRLKNKSKRARDNSDDPRSSKDIIEELNEERKKIETRIDNERKKRESEKHWEEREKELDRREVRLKEDTKALNERIAIADAREQNRDVIMSERIKAILVTERTMMEEQKAKLRNERLKILEETVKRESVLRTRERKVAEREEKLGINLYEQNPSSQESNTAQEAKKPRYE